MPRPDDPGSQGKGRGKANKSKSINKYLRKGWEAAKIPQGQTRSEPLDFVDPSTQDVSLFGQVFDENGERIKHKPHLRVVEDLDAGTAVIASPEPLQQTVQVLYIVEDSPEDDEEEPTT